MDSPKNDKMNYLIASCDSHAHNDKNEVMDYREVVPTSRNDKMLLVMVENSQSTGEASI